MIITQSTIVEKNNTITKYTPVYPFLRWSDNKSFSSFNSPIDFVKIDGHEYITGSLRPNTEINLISISNVGDDIPPFVLDDKIKVKDVRFYIGNDPFSGTFVPYAPEFEFKEAPNEISMKMIIDEPFESHGPSYYIKGRMKGEVRLDMGTIKVWTEDVSVTDEDGEDVTNQFLFVDYNVDATKVLITRKQ